AGRRQTRHPGWQREARPGCRCRGREAQRLSAPRAARAGGPRDRPWEWRVVRRRQYRHAGTTGPRRRSGAWAKQTTAPRVMCHRTITTRIRPLRMRSVTSSTPAQQPHEQQPRREADPERPGCRLIRLGLYAVLQVTPSRLGPTLRLIGTLARGALCLRCGVARGFRHTLRLAPGLIGGAVAVRRSKTRIHGSDLLVRSLRGQRRPLSKVPAEQSPYSRISPLLWATATASVRLMASSLVNIDFTCVLAVPSVIERRRAISLLLLPCATSSRTSNSLCVRLGFP